MTELIEQPGESRLAAVKRMAAAGALGGGKKEGRLIVSLDRISEDRHNERRTFRNMDGLIASVKSVGLIEPLTVTPEADGFRIVTGHRRFRAAKAAGLTQVEVLIREPDDERTRRQKSLVSNVQREDIGPVELAEALRSLLDDDHIIDSQKKLAAAIGKDKTWVSRMLRILDLPIRLREKVASTQLSLSYDAVAEIARLDDPKHQAELVDALLSGATQQEIRQRIREMRGKPRNSETPKPKRVYHTDEKATVIVQSEGHRLTLEQTVGALQQALKQAKEELHDKS